MDEPVTWKAAAGPVAAVESPPARGSSPGRGAGGTFEWSPKDFETVPHSKIHRLRCREIEDALEIWLEDREAYVGGDQNVYYDEGDLDKVLAPDVFVVFGVSKRLRINYRIWAEGPPPCFVLEVLSPSTRRRDLVDKKAIYERMGVREYFVFEGADDEGRVRGRPIDPALQGFRLRAGGPDGRGTARYEPITAWSRAERPSGGVTVGYTSEVLGLGVTLRSDCEGVRFLDAESGSFLPTAEEARLLVENRAAEERARADEEHARAAEERARADAERAARTAAEARIAELERLLAVQDGRGRP